MKLPLTYFGNPVLRTKCEDVLIIDENIRQFVMDMIDSLIEYNGIGLAAPQVNRSLRIFITAVPTDLPNGDSLPGKLRVFINPKIVWVSEEKKFRSEGCLSIPKIFAQIERPTKIRVHAIDLDGQEFEEEFSGLEARCILHENDHINGVLMIDRLRGKEREKLDPMLREIKKKFQNKTL